jgi:hypothetical protein
MVVITRKAKLTLKFVNGVLKRNLVPGSFGLEQLETLDIPSLLRGFEIWTHRQRDRNTFQAAGSELLRRPARCSILNRKINQNFTQQNIILRRKTL